MLEHYVFPQVEHIECENNIRVIFQQDSCASPHYSLKVDRLSTIGDMDLSSRSCSVAYENFRFYTSLLLFLWLCQEYYLLRKRTKQTQTVISKRVPKSDEIPNSPEDSDIESEYEEKLSKNIAKKKPEPIIVTGVENIVDFSTKLSQDVKFEFDAKIAGN